MKGVQHLLLLAVFALLARCQQKSQVSMSPILKQIFSGDLFFLKCDNSASESTVTWYINGSEQSMTANPWKIGAASPKHSGTYQCESSGGTKSDSFSINVLEHAPSASLTIKTGQPVVRTGSSVVLQLENVDGLQGWKCFVDRGGQTRTIKLKLRNDNTSVVFQPNKLNVPETIFWCTDNSEQHRSNQITVRTSVKDVSLEMYPLPAIVGESLILKCLVWGTDQISHTVFYKNNNILPDSHSSTFKITDVTESAIGSYKCDATFTHNARTEGPSYKVTSDEQEVLVQAPPMKAFLSANPGKLACSCSRCPDSSAYQWYYKNNSQQWALMHNSQAFMEPKESGIYACRAVWNNGKSSPSNDYVVSDQSPTSILLGVVIVIVIVLVILVLVLACVLFLKRYKKRNATGRIYEDMPLKSRDTYEVLQKGAQRDGEYDTLHPEAPGRQKKEGEYEALKKEEMTGGEYHTVRMEGAAGGEGGYEALKKEGGKEGVYHTLGMEGAVGGEGGYEALKKEGGKEGVYHTLGMEGAVGGEGGYEALKKEGGKEGVYHTLGMEGAVGGEGGYEALKKEGGKEGVYHTLGMKGAAGQVSEDTKE